MSIGFFDIKNKKEHVVKNPSQTLSDIIAFNTIYDNSKKKTVYDTMIPLYLYINEKEQLSRIQCPSVNNNNELYCSKFNFSVPENWKLYTYWVFNFINLPPLPNSMKPFIITNDKNSPFNLKDISITGLQGNISTNIDISTAIEKPIFDFIDIDNTDSFRFVTYTKPVPNTRKLYIYDTTITTGSPDIRIQEKDTPNIFITPYEQPHLRSGATIPYIWVCENKYTTFRVHSGIIIPDNKGIGYNSALKQTIKNTKNWIEYKGGSANIYRSELNNLNWVNSFSKNWKALVIVFSIILIIIIFISILYLFKN